MLPFPHHYSVEAAGTTDGSVAVMATGLPPLITAAPAEFGGPGGYWSPETLLVAAAANCFILTFRSIARASKLAWTALRCTATGTLDRAAGVTRFTALTLHAHLVLPSGADADRARRLLEKSEHSCLITNSLALSPTLDATVEVAAAQSHAA